MAIQGRPSFFIEFGAGDRQPEGFLVFYEENGEIRHEILVGSEGTDGWIALDSYLRRLYNRSRDYYNR